MGAGLLGLGLLGMQVPEGQVQELPDGLRIELRGWTFGPNHTFIDGDYAHRLLLQGGDAWAVLGGYRATHEDMGNDLVLWFRSGELEFPGRALSTAWIDPHGCRISTGSGWSSALPHWGLCTARRPFWDRNEIQPPERRWVDAPRITPRRGQNPLRYAIVDHRRSEPLASFTVPGVQKVSADTAGTPVPLPQRSTVGDTTFVLKSLRHEAPGAYPLSRSAVEIGYEGRSVASRSWKPVRVFCEDGTGNELATALPHRPAGKTVLFDTLCRRDPAWKLSVRFARTEPWRVLPDAVWQVRNLRAAGPGEEIELGDSFSGAGMGVRLECLWGVDPTQPAAPGDPGRGNRRPQLMFNLAGPEGGYLRLMRMTDQSGRDLLALAGQRPSAPELCWDFTRQEGTGEHTYFRSLVYPRTTRRLNLTFGFYRTRTAEFVVRP